MNKKMLFLFNLKAGTAGIRTKAADIINIFTQGGYDVLAHPSQSSTDMEDFVSSRGREFDTIVTCGGDGSLNDTINGMMKLEEPPVLGYIPTGTMNDFASSHNLSSNMLRAARDIVLGDPVYTDIGCFNGRYFSYVAAFGAFTDVAYDTPQSAKNVLGKGAYIMEGLKRLPLIASHHFTVECEELSAEGDFIYGMGSNTLSVGGFKLSTKNPPAMNDGKFSVVLVKKGFSDVLNAQVMLAAIMQGLDNNRLIDYVKTRKVKFHSDELVSWTLDGEFGGYHYDAEIECVPDKLKIIVPPRSRMELPEEYNDIMRMI